VKSRLSAFRLTSGAYCTSALILIVFCWSADRAQAVNPNIIMLPDNLPPLPVCGDQPQKPQITYAAKVGDVVENQPCPGRLCPEISVIDAPGGVFWELASGACLDTGPGTGRAIQCGPFSIRAPSGLVSPGEPRSPGNVKISSGPISESYGGGIFTVTATAESGTPSCPWDYLVRVTSNGGGWGDPHITTVDGLHYDFQGAGEFTALREDDLEIQTRHKPVPTTTVPGPGAHTELGVCVSIYSAVAARIGSNRVSLQPNLSGEPDPTGLQLRVNGELVALTDDGIGLRSGGSGTDLRADRMEPAAQLEGRITKTEEGAYVFTDARGTQLVVTPAYWNAQQTWYLNLNVYQTSATEGYWGRLGDDSWLPALPDGTSLGSRPEALDQRYRDLYETFADAWRVTDETSLFDYAPGTSTATFTLADWPRFNTQSCLIEGVTAAEPTDPATAEQACNAIIDPDQRADCIFDVTVTGHTGFAESYERMQEFEPHGTGWQPALAGFDLPTSERPWWWWWIVILILVLIVIAVLIARRKKSI
jgi:hypothetical protein